MASPTSNKGYTYPAHGGGVGTWDTNLNGNFEYQDLNLGGYYSITASSSITVANTFNSTFATIASTARSITISASIAQNLFYNLTGTLASSLAINMPAAGSIYVLGNNVTTGSSYEVVTQPTGGASVTLTSGGQTLIAMRSDRAFRAQDAFGAITALSLTTSSGITATGPITQNSSQYEQLPYGPTAARPTVPSSGMFRYNSTLGAIEWWQGTAWVGPGNPPTVQRFTSGSGNCTPSTGVMRWRVVICGAGASGSAAAAGTSGVSALANTTFGAWSAAKGNATSNGNTSTSGGTGGTGGTTGTGTLIDRKDGGNGFPGEDSTTTAAGGAGGQNPFGGAGAGTRAGAGTVGKANTGAGGAGAGTNNAKAGNGGGAGEYVSFWVNNPTVTAYSVPAGGTGGGGADGGSAYIQVEEFYD